MSRVPVSTTAGPLFGLVHGQVGQYGGHRNVFRVAQRALRLVELLKRWERLEFSLLPGEAEVEHRDDACTKSRWDERRRVTFRKTICESGEKRQVPRSSLVDCGGSDRPRGRNTSKERAPTYISAPLWRRLALC